MACMGFPGDFDPRDEEPEWQCIECEGIVVRDGKHKTKCLDCGQEWEADVEPRGEDW